MTFVVTRVLHMPVLFVRFDLPLFRHISDVQLFSALCARIVAEEGGPLTRVIDLSDSEIEFSDLLLLLGEVRLSRAGSMTDARIRTIFVGTLPLIALGIERIEAEFGAQLLQFACVHDALAFAHSACEI